jgi:hypothetical protein
MRVMILVLLLAVGAVAAWTWLTLAYSYSDGERAGVLQKFSHRGWLCKTSEGELAQYVVPGIAPVFWEFSVRDPAVEAQINSAVGRKVQLHYTEHRGVPSSCFGDTGYYVDRVTLVDESPPTAAAPAAVPAAPSATAMTTAPAAAIPASPATVPAAPTPPPTVGATH